MEYKMVIQASLNTLPVSIKPITEDELSNITPIETINFPTELQEWIMSRKEDFERDHPYVYPNVIVIQDSVFASYNFPRDIINMNQKDRPEWFSKQFRELYDNLEKWQGKLLFEWMGMKVYNRGHVIGNRDFPLIFLEV